MLKNAADISPSDQIILKGILDGFGEILDLTKIVKFNSEVKKIFISVKQDSEGLTDDSLYQIAYHMARNRGKTLSSDKKNKDVLLKTPATTSENFQQPIVKRKPKEDVTNITTVPTQKNQTLNDTEDKKLVVRRAIFDGFDTVGNLTKATTIEHIDSEANNLYSWYIDAKDIDNQQLYQVVFQAAKNKAEEIMMAHQTLVDQESKSERKIKKKEELEKNNAEKERIAEIAKIELREFIAKLLEESDKKLSSVSKEALRYFKLIYLDNKTDPAVVHLFPGTSRDQRYKWKERAISMVAPYVSEDARKYIGEKTKRKYASGRLLLKVAHIFQIRCQKD